MTTNNTTPEAIVWRGIRFEPEPDECYSHCFLATELPWTLELRESFGVECWWVCDGDSEVGEGGTAEEALESARSQIESIARAVGLIPDVEGCRRLIDAVRWGLDPEGDGIEEYTESASALEALDQLAAKLGKGER